MFILKFKVDSQVITWENPARIPVENTCGYLYAQFDTDSEWSGMAKTAVFQTGTRQPVMVTVTDELVKVPSECLKRGQMAVGLIGLDESGTVRLVTRQMRRGIPLNPSIPVDGIPPEESTPALWEQVLAKIGDLTALTTLDKSSLVAAINEAAQTGSTTGGGLSEAAKTLLIGILRNGVYQTDQSEQITALENALAAGDSGEAVTYTVQNVLTNVTSSNSVSVIAEDAAYRAVLTAKDGYVLDTVTVSMGGRDITDTAYSGGVVEIAAVTGDVVITAAAVENSTAVRYTIAAELVNVTSSNSAADVEEGGSYLATLTAAEGYEIDTVTVTMGGVDVTAAVYADGVITIASVTGNVEIVASAKVVSAAAELITDGLLGYWDLRNPEAPIAKAWHWAYPPNEGSGNLYGSIPGGTQGSQSLPDFDSSYGYTGFNIVRGEDTYPNTANDVKLGTAFTFVILTHNGLPAGTVITGSANGVVHSNIQPMWSFQAKYDTAEKTNVATENKGSGNGDVLTGYNFIVKRVSGSSMKTILNTSSCEFAGADYDGFVCWDQGVTAKTVNSTGTVIACAVYDRALNDVEIEELRAFFKTMEVTA